MGNVRIIFQGVITYNELYVMYYSMTPGVVGLEYASEVKCPHEKG